MRAFAVLLLLLLALLLRRLDGFHVLQPGGIGARRGFRLLPLEAGKRGGKGKLSGSRQADLLKKFEENRAKKKQAEAMGALEKEMGDRREARKQEAAGGASSAPASSPTPNANWRQGSSSAATAASMDDLLETSDVKGGDPSAYSSFDRLLENTAELSFKDDNDASAMATSSSASPPSRGVGKEGSPPTKFVRLGDFTPIEEWQRLIGMDEGPVELSTLVKCDKPIVVIADPRGGTSDMTTLLNEIRAKLPLKLADIIVITPDTPAYNRKLAKKTRVAIPILSDAHKRWMDVHLVTAQQPWGPVVYVLDPKFLKVVRVALNVPVLGLVDQIKSLIAGL